MRVDYNSAIRDVLQVAMVVSPTGEEQAAFVVMQSKMYKDGCTSKETLSQLLGAIKDGIDHNNWPKR